MALLKYNGKKGGEGASSVAGGSSAGVDMSQIAARFLPATRIENEDGTSGYQVSEDTQFVKQLSLVTEDGTKVAILKIDANGNIYTEANIVTAGDVVARGLDGQMIPTIQEWVDEYLAEHGAGGGIASIELSLNQSDYKLQAIVTNLDGDTITSNVIDFPIESVVVGGSYDATNKNIVLTLKNGGQVTFSVADLVRGLASTAYVDSAVGGITKSSIGLGNVDNTSDANKPISTATQTALNGKLSLSGGTMTGGFVFQKTESNTAYIYDVVNGNGVITTPLWKSTSTNNACSIRNALAFKWYNDIYQIGAIRGAATNCDGWGVTKGNNDLLFQINPYGSGFFKGEVVALSIIKSLNNTNGRWSVIDGGDIKLGAPSRGGWAQQLSVRNNDDTSTISAIAGAYGSGTTLNWNYYGGSYDAPWLKLTSTSALFNGDVTAYSDRRLKSDVKDLEYRGSLSPKTYIKDGKKCIGFVAQDVRKLYPELVLGEEKEDEYLSLNYGAITAVLAAENKELKKKVESLEDRIAKLEALLVKGGEA